MTKMYTKTSKTLMGWGHYTCDKTDSNGISGHGDGWTIEEAQSNASKDYRDNKLMSE